jgi:hypothetical protein
VKGRSPWQTALLLTALALASAVGADVPAAVKGIARGRAFWSTFARECSPPPGETAFPLVEEAVSFLGSPESEWRDDVGYGVVASCVYQKRTLKPAERRALVRELLANLRRGIGAAGDDSVLLRSFSALDLSVLAALENLDPVLDEAGYRGLLEGALAYLHGERDLRGFEPRVGWIHATAHTADLLKFLARDPRFTRADQGRLLDAVWLKLTTPGTPVFTHAEDERLSSALASLVRRTDFDAAAFRGWLGRFPPLEKSVWTRTPPEPSLLDSSQNARELLRSLFVELWLPAPPAAPDRPRAAMAVQTAARDEVLATLAAIRR